MKMGYARVSKADGRQVLDLQFDALQQAGVDEDHLYTDQASGKLDDRAGLESCLKALREGDTLIVWKLDRLGRSLKHLADIVHSLSEKNIGFKVLSGQGLILIQQQLPENWFFAFLHRLLNLNVS
jgi:DNA invertase Pin-like site-specific DNA recombinase